MDQQRLTVKFLTGTAFVLVVGLAWMHWRSEDREAARVRKDVEILRQKPAEAEAKARAEAEARAQAEAEARAQAEAEKAKAFAEGRLKRV